MLHLHVGFLMIMRLHVVGEQFLYCGAARAPWRNASLFNMCICNLHTCTLDNTLLVCSLLMMHTWLNAAYWEFMVCLVEAGCYIKATLQLHGCQKTQWKCSPVLVIIC